MLDFTTAEILRFAQNDITQGFFGNLLNVSATRATVTLSVEYVYRNKRARKYPFCPVRVLRERESRDLGNVRPLRDTPSGCRHDSGPSTE